jgi:hypothetical protein
MGRAREGMKDEFGNTFWFYYVFGCSAATLASPTEASRI